MFNIFKRKLTIDKLSVIELKENDLLVLEFDECYSDKIYQRLKEQVEKHTGVKVLLIEKGKLKAVLRKY